MASWPSATRPWWVKPLHLQVNVHTPLPAPQLIFYQLDGVCMQVRDFFCVDQKKREVIHGKAHQASSKGTVCV